ncbi:MAG TPA: SDR family oxidoreductase [Tenuifilaceae bacterium]|nr:SDR family oxidoreductase [Tenuifilaceae bacterium]
MVNFRNRIAWVTGASSGIGKEIALALAREQAHLILSAKNPEELEVVASECRKYTPFCHEVPFDLSDPEEVERIAKSVVNTYGHIFLLINNGGISQRSLAVETPVEIDRKIMEVDYFSHVIITKTVIPGMIEAGVGYIAATSSISGKFGFMYRSAYAAAKHAIQGFFETLRVELKPYNISVTIAYPGRIRTSISLHALDKEGNEYGKMDPGQSNGLAPQKCAKRYIRAVKRRKPEILIGKSELLMVHIKRLLPSLFYKMVSRVNPV